MMEDPLQLKENGNECFQRKDYDKAIDCYTKAIQLAKDKKVLAVLYKNRAACHLKKDDYVPAASDASRAIDIDASDIKALYRRSQALEKLGKLDQAFKDVQRCATVEPNNKTFQETLRRLNNDIQDKLKIQFSTDSRVERMFEVLLDENIDKERKEKAANNLIVLAREDAGAERIFQNNGLNLLMQLIETKKPELIVSAVRTLAGMCSRHKSRAIAVLHFVGLEKICRIMALENEEIALATSSFFQTILDNFEGVDSKEHRGKEEALVLATSKDVKMIITHLLEMLIHKDVSGHGRDQALNLLIRNVPRKDLGIKDNTKSLDTIDIGLKKILKVGGQIPELPSCLPLTENTCLTASILLNNLYNDLRCDDERTTFRKICEEYVTNKFDPKNMEKNLHAIQCISALLQGPFDVGNSVMALQGVMEMMVALCGSEREIDQMVAIEAIIHAASKASRATFIISNGITLLKDIYKKSTNEKIKIRALVGLCKLGSAGGTDYGLRQFSEGSTEKLAKQCRKWICNQNIDTRTRKWAIEGMAYLTLDADVKDDFVQDEPAMQAMFELSKSADKTILYAVASILVNCTNSYDVKEKIPELVELAKLSKQHVPEDHPKDKKDFVMLRVKRLIKVGVVSALAVMLKADSAILTDQTKELMARVFLALVEDVRDRGIIVAQGGGKTLLPLALHGTDIGKTKASHALAKIAAVSNPEIAFPGERIYEVVRPLVRLLNTECDGLQNYEALMSLTNLSEKSDKLRLKIIKEKAMPEIECYMFEEHDQIRQAATECMCNMVNCKEVQDRFVAEGNDQLKLLVLLCGEDDAKLQRAAAGAVAMLTASRSELCHKMTSVSVQWLEILQRLCIHDNLEVQHRGLVITYNLMAADKEIAKKLIESELLEILTVISKLENNVKRQVVINTARECLVKAMDYSLIKPTSQAGV
ncbi:protein unc-45 homolog B isoform X2 [Scyliorhinus canicula]|uniref:protein unc-45 homolog B isoform X1 n=2 Tax=Scyliorhinus canicula TaxID=7830 RepID=UPI0018F47AC3|nr:protein unc-45 homolog B isoform X1 [Scyliorhinus canicula]XP_038660003.1 protein unc-45 homolog B isoform X2 [Scyliorhinus canicula]